MSEQEWGDIKLERGRDWVVLDLVDQYFIHFDGPGHHLGISCNADSDSVVLEQDLRPFISNRLLGAGPWILLRIAKLQTLVTVSF